MNNTPTTGDAAPDFTTTTSTGESVALSSLRGSWVVIFFYPRDNTPGCTREACGFRDLWKELNHMNVKVFGVSTDTAASHRKFIEKYDLPFPLLLDEGHGIAEAYGAWGEKAFMGRKFMGTLRMTYLINPQGQVAHVWEKVKPDTHAAEVVERLRHLQAG